MQRNSAGRTVLFRKDTFCKLVFLSDLFASRLKNSLKINPERDKHYLLVESKDWPKISFIYRMSGKVKRLAMERPANPDLALESDRQ